MSLRWLPLVSLFASGTALAQDRPPLDYVVVEPSPYYAGGGAKVIYLNPCTAGCTARKGTDNAAANTSSILGRDNTPAEIALDPFRWDASVWDATVACVRANYAPFDVTVVTDEPTSGRYLEVMVAGTASALGLAGNTLGVAPLTSNCSALPTAIAYTFANAHQPGADQVAELCATVIHEAGHLYGLDHEYLCRDAMTYLSGCGDKIFVNRSVQCGEFDGPRACKCGATQNSFVKLTREIGASATTPAPAEVRIDVPLEGAIVTPGFTVFATVTSTRPIADMELWVNGWPWARVGGKEVDAPYQLATPANLPDGVLHLEVRTRDDLGSVGVVARTVQKGVSCSDASTCLLGQSCNAGACTYPAATGALGAACSADEECASGLCIAAEGASTCSAPCFPDGAVCGDGFTCRAGDDEGFACLTPAPDDGGCCSSSRDPRGSIALFAIVVAALGFRARGDRGARGRRGRWRRAGTA